MIFSQTEPLGAKAAIKTQYGGILGHCSTPGVGSMSENGLGHFGQSCEVRKIKI
jgi:hypothetical protein